MNSRVNHDKNITSQNRHQEISFFNNFAQNKDYDSLTEYGYRSIIKAFHKLLEEKSLNIHTAVDFGCGTGSFTRRFLKNSPIKSYGVDIAFDAIQRAQSKNDNTHYFVSDISNVGIKNESMDLVIFSAVLHHFPNISPCLDEAYRILKKGGILLSFDPHLHNPFMWLYRNPNSIFYSNVGITANERLLSKDEMREVLKKTRFSDIKISAISGVTISYVESTSAFFLLPFYNSIEFGLGLLPIAKDIGSFLICYARKE